VPVHAVKDLATVIIAATALLAPLAARSEDSDSAMAECPGYADHLRNAQAYLEHADRQNALAELKRARDSLSTCDTAQADETALAARPVWNPRG
jgi:hypothetical protein